MNIWYNNRKDTILFYVASLKKEFKMKRYRYNKIKELYSPRRFETQEEFLAAALLCNQRRY